MVVVWGRERELGQRVSFGACLPRAVLHGGYVLAWTASDSIYSSCSARLYEQKSGDESQLWCRGPSDERVPMRCREHRRTSLKTFADDGYDSLSRFRWAWIVSTCYIVKMERAINARCTLTHHATLPVLVAWTKRRPNLSVNSSSNRRVAYWYRGSILMRTVSVANAT